MYPTESKKVDTVIDAIFEQISFCERRFADVVNKSILTEKDLLNLNAIEFDIKLLKNKIDYFAGKIKVVN